MYSVLLLNIPQVPSLLVPASNSVASILDTPGNTSHIPTKPPLCSPVLMAECLNYNDMYDNLADSIDNTTTKCEDEDTRSDEEETDDGIDNIDIII